ncbi:MAG: PPC domain-containing protein [Hyphomonadaceae bacterium]|nr:PPC domain-containing protein [Hyphomonadaceae bacterium]
MRGNLLFGAAAAALLAFGLSPASAQTNDQPGDASTTATLTGNVDGEISPAGDTDWYRLEVQTGHRYNLALAGLENDQGETLDPMLGVYDAEGNQLAFNDDANGTLNSALRYVPQQSGVVYVEARAFSSEATGPYRLGVSSEEVPPDDAAGDASTRARASAGRTTNGNIEYEGDFDWYRFSARTGNRYHITLNGAGEGGLGDPVLRVLDRDGNVLAENDDSNGSLNSALDFIPAANSDVFIEARGYSDSYTGPYALDITAERLPRDNIGNTPSTRGRINAGQTIEGTLDFPSDTDWYRVRLTEGQSYRFTLNASGDTPIGDPLIRLHDSRGEEVAMDDDGGWGLNSYLEFTAPSTGNYYVEATSFTGDATGGYTLAAYAGDIPADASTDATLSADGDYREGILAPAGDRDWYRLTLEQGQGVRIGMQATGTPDSIGDSYLVLYGPDGAEVARDDDGGDGLNAWLEYQAPTAGTYFVEARGFSEDAAGRYAINVVAGEIGDSFDGAEALQANGDARTSFIGTPGDVDWFALEMVEGRPYRIYVDGAEDDALADPLLTLYDATGAEVARDDDGGTGLNSYLYFASTTGGPYFAAVSSYDGQSTGRYVIRAVDTDVPGHAYTDEIMDANNDSRLSRIEIPGDIDVYRVTLEAGVTYQIEANGSGSTPLADPFLSLIQEGAGMEDAGPNGPDALMVRQGGRQVASDDDSGPGNDARLRFRPETSGDYLINVSGLSNTVGGYEVKIVRR